MQTASGTLATAIQGRERQPVVTATADFAGDGSAVFDPGVFSDTFTDTFRGLGNLNDLTPFVVSANVDRSLSTDLPDAAKLDAGSGAAAGSVTLAGSLGGISVAELFSAHHNPLTDLAPRLGAGLRLALGMRGSVGVETLPALTGAIRGCSVNPDDGTVTLDLLDYRDRMRTPVAFPVLVADDWDVKRPGLNAQFLMDRIARANGFYASPPTRAQCFLHAPLHGSAYPLVGTLTTAGTASGANPRGQATFAALGSGALGMGATGGLTSNARWAVATGLNTNSGSVLFLEATVRISGAGGRVALVRSVAGVWTAAVDCVAGAVQVTVQRNGATSGAVSVALAGLTVGADHYVGVHIAFTGTGFNVNARVDGAGGSATGTVASSTGSPDLSLVDVGAASTVIVAALQVTNEAFSAGMFNNAFVPSAVFEQSLNELVATPTVDSSDPWTLLQQLAEAEQGVVLFDENGVLRFYNRAHLSGGAAVNTLTTDPAVSWPNLVGLASREDGDGVRNYITVPAAPPSLDPPNTVIWAVAEVLTVPALSTIYVSAELPGPAYTLTSVGYQAAKDADGTGGDVSNLAVGVTQLSNIAYQIRVDNPNAFDVFLVNNSTVPAQTGDPALILTGRCLRVSGDGYVATRAHAPSVTKYGTQALDLSANTFRQSTAAAEVLASHLSSALTEPHPVLDGVQVVGDPRSQLADRVRVATADGMRLDDEFWVVAVKTDIAVGSAFAQTVTLRGV